MKYREVAKLSLQQEKDILDSLIEFAASGEANMNNGSSRVVFCGIDAYTYDLLKDFVPAGRNVVVKINMGSAGVIQSQQERDVYESADSMQVEYLADIYCYGNCIQVMEAVSTETNYDMVNTRDIADEVYYCLQQDIYNDIDFATQVARSYYYIDCDKELNEEQTAFVNDNFNDIIEIRSCISLISELIGWTGDLTQLGKNQDGEIVLYDYGYFSDSGDECVNDCDDVWRFTQDNWLSVYLEDLIYNYGILELDDMKEIAATIEDCYEAQ